MIRSRSRFPNRRAGTLAGNSAQSQQFFDRLATPPSGARETLYANLIDGLVADGVWAKLDGLYVVAADEATFRENLVQSSYQLNRISFNGTSATYTADAGITGTTGGGGNFFTSNYSLLSAPGLYQQNDAMLAAWCASPTGATKALCGSYKTVDGSSDNKIRMQTDVGGTAYWNINTSGTFESPSTPSPSTGFWLMQRTASNASAYYRNDSLVSSSTLASAALPDEYLSFGAFNLTGRAFASGASLTSDQRTALYNRLTTYITGVVGSTP